MKEKYVKVFIIGIVFLLLVGTIGNVFAVTEIKETEEEVVPNSPGDNWLGRIISQIQFSIFKAGDFTIYGRELECAIFPTQQNNFKKWDEVILTAESGEAGFINWFRGSPDDGAYSDHPGDSRQFMREDYIEYGKSYDSTSFTCDAGAYWDNDCYWEFYLCPFPCYSDADCDSDEECDKRILSQVIDNAGVCKEIDEEGEIIELTHKTKVYECSDGEKTLIKTVSDGDKNFCRDPDKNNYLIPGVGSSGVCYELENEPKICTEKPAITGDKEIGEECSTDIECSTLHCDKAHWYSLKSTCQPTPWDTIKKVAQPKSKIKDMTTMDKMAILCTSDNECVVEDPEKYKANCIPISILRDEGIVHEGTKEFWDYADGFFYGTVGGGLAGAAIGGGLCVLGGAAIGFIFPASIPAILAAGPTICSGITIVGAGVGAYEGLKAGVSIDEKSELAKAIGAEDDDAAGLCVEETKGFNIESLAFFDITGDKKTDGLIIGVGGLILLFVLFSRLGGHYGKIKYEI